MDVILELDHDKALQAHLQAAVNENTLDVTSTTTNLKSDKVIANAEWYTSVVNDSCIISNFTLVAQSDQIAAVDFTFKGSLELIYLSFLSFPERKRVKGGN